MHIGIIGTGSVGTALATGFTTAGHDVVLGSRSPVDTVGPDGVAVESQQDAVAHSEVVVLAVPGGAAPEVAADLADELAGETLIDATNEYPEPTADRSLAERVADAAPAASVVKAFNTIGANRMTDPVVDGDRATMFLAGEDTDTVTALASDLGFEPVVAGDLGAADRLEHLARLWIDLSQEHGRDIAFKLLQE
jgi:predicted dinucleotide-binding enzyme